MACTTKEAREGVRFLATIRELLASGQVWLCHKDQQIDDQKNSAMIGWFDPDKDVVYLLPKIALKETQRVSDLKITIKALCRQLEEESALAERDKEQHTVVRRVGTNGLRQRVLAIKKNLIW